MPILSYENELNLHVNEISFSYERMGTKTHFAREAERNSEMAYHHTIPMYMCTCVPRGKSRPQQICNVMTEVCFMILKIVTAVSVIQKLPEIARATTTSPEVMAFYEHLTSKRYVW